MVGKIVKKSDCQLWRYHLTFMFTSISEFSPVLLNLYLFTKIKMKMLKYGSVLSIYLEDIIDERGY